MKDSATLPAQAIYFVVGNKKNNIFGYCWRIGWSGTSFYIKARYAPLAALKISLHGPDPRPGLHPGFKIAMEGGAVPGALAAGGVYCGGVALRPSWFSGHERKGGVIHAITFRSTWDLFVKGAASAPGPGDLKSRTEGLVIPSPVSLYAADLEIYISDRKPYWKHESRARRDNACTAPIRNNANQYLTGVSFRRNAFNGDMPEAATALKAAPGEERIRGIGTSLDSMGVLWIVEQWMSVSKLKEFSESGSEDQTREAHGQGKPLTG